MMNEKSFISSRPRLTTTLDHARRPRQTTPDDHDAHILDLLATTHVANREAFHPFFFPSPLLHLGSM
jgi:hypothetical protein